MRKRLITLFTILFFLAGISLLLYPTVSEYWNHVHQSRAIVEYTEKVRLMDREKFQKMWAEAEYYNSQLFKAYCGEEILPSEMPVYEDVLNVSGDGMMSYVEVPKINCRLPVVHDTLEAKMQDSIGHIRSSSFPVGGVNTHCVLTGHRGLPSARLFTDLDLVTEGDIFFVETLGVRLYYEIDQILVVLPEEFGDLGIQEGKDYCTLVTCTPYGVNSHRMLVRGHRIDEPETIPGVDGESVVPVWRGKERLLIMAGIALFLMILFLLLLVRKKKSAKKKSKKEKTTAGTEISARINSGNDNQQEYR